MESHNYTAYTLAKSLHSKHIYTKAKEHIKTIKTFIKLTGLDKDNTTKARRQTYLLKIKHPRPNKLRSVKSAQNELHTENTLTQLLNLHQAYQTTASTVLKTTIDQILQLQEGQPKSPKMTHSEEKSLNRKAKDKAPTTRNKTNNMKQNHTFRKTRTKQIPRKKGCCRAPTQTPTHQLDPRQALDERISNLCDIITLQNWMNQYVSSPKNLASPSYMSKHLPPAHIDPLPHPHQNCRK